MLKQICWNPFCLILSVTTHKVDRVVRTHQDLRWIFSELNGLIGCWFRSFSSFRYTRYLSLWHMLMGQTRKIHPRVVSPSVSIQDDTKVGSFFVVETYQLTRSILQKKSECVSVVPIVFLTTIFFSERGSSLGIM